ncbi:ATP-dependent sacrificial sulfur transferase LarE [Motilibacter aurantiacus]|uniref:ATP-dependent sacrificial sulfur transferase LarE n=1 Tax=Motilibacter aurantiacus TaxID=2714955 RepID=UPI0014090376|nr:ATP-dependent sacrificial sulfur transferase LarE [Motilibacter aurantiacus]NHC46699.1 ATP-dependent sacrificial sulfur transferase LarE [Motilibacter aurantiacus]
MVDVLIDADGAAGAAERLSGWFNGHGCVLVAFSGGADSALVLAAAARTLGPGSVVAATASSDSLPEVEARAAEIFARELGVEHLLVRTDEMSVDGYRANAGNRCYFCKSTLLDTVGPIARERGAVVLTGTNADDRVAGFRPGMRAAAERGAREPLAECGMSKPMVRAVSRLWGLRTWDKPAAACLSSRIAYGLEITPARLHRVGRAEAGLRELLAASGLPRGNVRVRDLGDEARVEVDEEIVSAVQGLRALSGVLQEAGFSEAFNVRAFTSGSLNAMLQAPASWS